MEIKGTILEELKIGKIVPFLLLFFWIVITPDCANITNFHVDEIWHWHIASSLNLLEIIKFMHYEGHTFLWYLILKPFTYFDSLFPFILKYINWFFMLGSMILILFFSPFNNLVKILITVSSPFLLIYPVIGRSYGLGIFLLLLLTLFYKDRLQRPVLYSVIIFFAANTHVLTTVGVAAFSCIFIFDLINNKVNQRKQSLSICLLTIISLIIQWVPIYLPGFIHYYNKLDLLKNSFFPNESIISVPILWLVYILVLLSLLYIAAKKLFIRETCFITLSYIGLFFLFCVVYFVAVPYFYFFYVYLIIYYWLIKEKAKECNEKSIQYILLIVFFLISIIFSSLVRKENNYTFNYYDYMNVVNKINSIIPKGSTVYVVWGQEFYYILNKDYKVYDTYGRSITSYETFKNSYKQRKLDPHEINVKKGVKSYYLSYGREYTNNIDKNYPKFSVGDNYRHYEILDISKE